MIRRPNEVGVENFLAAGSRAATFGLQRDENGVNVSKHIGSVHGKNPPARRVVINSEVAQALRLAEVRLAITPRLENTALVILPVLQIEGIEDQKFLLDVIYAPVGAFRLTITSHVIHIHDVQVTRAE